jgi:hypothetical protein
MVEYNITIKKNKKSGSEDRYLQTWVSFFSILKNLPKEEYLRYTEGFLLSLKKETDVSLDLLVSSILKSADLKRYFQHSFSLLDQESILYLLERIAQMWPREKDIIFRLKSIVEKNPSALVRNSSWFRTLSLDFVNYILTGKRTEMYIENVSKKPVSGKRLENILKFPLINKQLNS